MAHDPNKRQQELELKDGRKLFRTHNGFKSFLEEKDGTIIPVSTEYYIKCKKKAVRLERD
jgi:hypothetical protein